MEVYEHLLMDAKNNCIDVIKCTSPTWRSFENFIHAWYARTHDVQKIDKKYKPDFIVTSKHDSFFVECKQLSTLPKMDNEINHVNHFIAWMNKYRIQNSRQAERIKTLCKTQNVKFAFHCKTNRLAFIVDLDTEGNIKWKSS